MVPRRYGGGHLELPDHQNEGVDDSAVEGRSRRINGLAPSIGRGEAGIWLHGGMVIPRQEQAWPHVQPPKKKKTGATIHDLKHIYTSAGQSLGIPGALLDALTNHAPTTITDRTYTNRALLLEPL